MVFEGCVTLVTGGAGFIGSHLVEALVASGARVRVLDNFVSGRLENLRKVHDRIEIHEGDIRNLDVCRRACDGVAVVLHQAGLVSVAQSIDDPATTLAVNIGGSANVLMAARDAGVRRVIYASSSAVYGDAQPPLSEEKTGVSLSAYDISKKSAEQVAGLFARASGMSLIGLRYFNVYGARQSPNGPYASVVPRFLRACLADEAPVIYGDGEQTRDFVHVSDVVRANWLAASSPLSGAHVINVGSGRAVSMTALAHAVCRLTGASHAPRHLKPRLGEARTSCADTRRARAQLGFVAKVSLEQGLQLTRADET
jgi:nucleoside-diphosphate-sugar epimerase